MKHAKKAAAKRGPVPRATVRRPTQTRAHETVACLVEAARAALIKFGYSKTTTNHIAEIAGVGVGSLYQYFRNKDEIVAAVLRDFATKMRERMRNAVVSNIGRPMPVIIAATIDQVVDAFAEERDLVRIVRQEVPARDGLRELDAAHNEAISSLAMLMRLVGAEADDVDLKAFVVFKAIDGVILGWLTDDKNRFTVDALKRELTTVATRILS